MYYVAEEFIESRIILKEVLIFKSDHLIKKTVIGYHDDVIYELIYQYDDNGRFLSYVFLEKGFEVKGFRQCEYSALLSEVIPVLDAEYNHLGEKIGGMHNRLVDQKTMRTDFFCGDQWLGFSLSDINEEEGDVVTQATYDAEGKPIDVIAWQQLIDYRLYE